MMSNRISFQNVINISLARIYRTAIIIKAKMARVKLELKIKIMNIQIDCLDFPIEDSRN